MPTSVEYTVEVHRIQLPPGCDCGHILVQSCNERDMTRPRFGRYAGVGDAEGATLKNLGAKEGRERAGCT